MQRLPWRHRDQKRWGKFGKKQNDVDLVGFFGWVRIVVSDDFVDIFARLFCPFFWYYLVVKSPRMLTVLDDPARMDARWFIPLGGL